MKKGEPRIYRNKDDIYREIMRGVIILAERDIIKNNTPIKYKQDALEFLFSDTAELYADITGIDIYKIRKRIDGRA